MFMLCYVCGSQRTAFINQVSFHHVGSKDQTRVTRLGDSSFIFYGDSNPSPHAYTANALNQQTISPAQDRET